MTVTVADSGGSVSVWSCVIVEAGLRIVLERLAERDPDGEDEHEAATAQTTRRPVELFLRRRW